MKKRNEEISQYAACKCRKAIAIMDVAIIALYAIFILAFGLMAETTIAQNIAIFGIIVIGIILCNLLTKKQLEVYYEQQEEYEKSVKLCNDLFDTDEDVYAEVIPTANNEKKDFLTSISDRATIFARREFEGSINIVLRFKDDEKYYEFEDVKDGYFTNQYQIK